MSAPKRQKFVHGGRTVYEWEQTLEDVNIYVVPPPKVGAKQIECEITSKHLILAIKGWTQRYLDCDFSAVVSAEDCYWSLSDGVIEIYLTKARTGELWPGVFVGHMSLSASDTEETKKALLLERFDRENPGLDFSGAKFTGYTVPDADKFLGGIDRDRIS